MSMKKFFFRLLAFVLSVIVIVAAVSFNQVRYYHDCNKYEEIVMSDTKRGSLLKWSKESYFQRYVDSNSNDFTFNTAPGMLEVVDSGLDQVLGYKSKFFFVNIIENDEHYVDYLYIGRSSRAGILIGVNGVIDDYVSQEYLTSKYEKIAVYCNQ